eukprot:GHVU01146462.1.p5 GENE.GHVU01146462.1~~GHVU01146462.1.p5  ORF type:complete len:116 (+),score=13.41 GHVU01146462.1:1130-1477(+)
MTSFKQRFTRSTQLGQGLDTLTLREVAMMKKLSHRNIRELIDVSFEGGRLEVAMEYLQAGISQFLKYSNLAHEIIRVDLKHYIITHYGCLPLRKAKSLLYQLLQVKNLHCLDCGD